MKSSSSVIIRPGVGAAAIVVAALAIACSGGGSSPTPSTTTSTAPTTTTTTIPTPTLVANFTVASLSPSQRKTATDSVPVTILPAGTADACPLVNSANPVLDCQFDGATSTGPIASYVWTYSFGTQQRTDTTTTPQFKPSVSGCGFFAGQSGSTSGGVQFIGMRVDLQVRDASGSLAAVRTNQNVRIFPAGLCGYGF